jgi:hypothetical protein
MRAVDTLLITANGRYGCSSLDNKHKALSPRRIEVRPPRSSPLACWRSILISFSLSAVYSTCLGGMLQVSVSRYCKLLLLLARQTSSHLTATFFQAQQ